MTQTQDTGPQPAAGSEASAAGTAAPVQVAVLAGYVGDDPTLIEMFLGEFRQTARTLGGTLEQALQGGQFGDAAAAAHQLKSPARAVGALVVGALCEQMETACKAGDAAATEALRAALRQELDAVERFLAARMAAQG